MRNDRSQIVNTAPFGTTFESLALDAQIFEDDLPIGIDAWPTEMSSYKHRKHSPGIEQKQLEQK
jgi:hypothetical protein